MSVKTDFLRAKHSSERQWSLALCRLKHAWKTMPWRCKLEWKLSQAGGRLPPYLRSCFQSKGEPPPHASAFLSTGLYISGSSKPLERAFPEWERHDWSFACVFLVENGPSPGALCWWLRVQQSRKCHLLMSCDNSKSTPARTLSSAEQLLICKLQSKSKRTKEANNSKSTAAPATECCGRKFRLCQEVSPQNEREVSSKLCN